jgi:hypothetical protein
MSESSQDPEMNIVDSINASRRDKVLAARESDEKLRHALTQAAQQEGAPDVCTPTTFCVAFHVNMHFLRRGLEKAALNGTATRLDAIRYCPWCGTRAAGEEPPDSPEEPEDLTNELIEVIWPRLDKETHTKGTINDAVTNVMDSWEPKGEGE